MSDDDIKKAIADAIAAERAARDQVASAAGFWGKLVVAWPRIREAAIAIGAVVGLIAGIGAKQSSDSADWQAYNAAKLSAANAKKIEENHQETKAVLDRHGKVIEKVAKDRPAKWGD